MVLKLSEFTINADYISSEVQSDDKLFVYPCEETRGMLSFDGVNYNIPIRDFGLVEVIRSIKLLIKEKYPNTEVRSHIDNFTISRSCDIRISKKEQIPISRVINKRIKVFPNIIFKVLNYNDKLIVILPIVVSMALTGCKVDCDSPRIRGAVERLKIIE